MWGIQYSFVPIPFFQTQTALPSATLNTFGAAVTFTPPSPYVYLLPIHLGLSTQAVGAETVTVRCLGFYADGTSAGGSSSYTSTTGDVDNQNILYGSVGASNGTSGQAITGKLLTSLQVAVQSSISASGASVIFRLYSIVSI